MLNCFKQWEKTVTQTLSGNDPRYDWKKLRQEHQLYVEYLNHERLIHLLVMLFVGMCTLLSAFFTMLLQKPELIIVDILLAALFIPYVFHYRNLENTVQRWYGFTQRIHEYETKK